MDNCAHLNETLDSHENYFVCTDCGLVKDIQYVYEKNPFYQFEQNHYSPVVNILDKFNISEYYSKELNSKTFKKRGIKYLASQIYKTVNEDNSSLPLKSLMNVTKLKTNQIKSNDIHILDIEKILEKYTTHLNLDFKTYTLIKEKIKLYLNTGFQPLSVIGGVIYLHCREHKKKLSMKTIASVLGISTISIQRFVKHVFSSRG